MRKVLVYVAGPYRGETAWAVETNIRHAEEVGMRVAEAGGIPIIPHTMYRFYDGTLDAEYWLAATLALLERCDAIMMLEGWEFSTGSVGEHDLAMASGIPIGYEVQGVGTFVRARVHGPWIDLSRFQNCVDPGVMAGLVACRKQVDSLKARVSEESHKAKALLRRNQVLERGFDHWQTRFCALSEVVEDGEVNAIVEAVCSFVRAQDDCAADEVGRELHRGRSLVALLRKWLMAPLRGHGEGCSCLGCTARAAVADMMQETGYDAGDRI